MFPSKTSLLKKKKFKRPRRRRRDTPTINFVGQLSDMMLGRVISPKYLDPSILVMDVHIDGNMVTHTLIDLGVAINVMAMESMLKLIFQGVLINTTTMLQLTDKSTVALKGIIEDVMVSIDSWEYPTDLLTL